jgi:tyrosinase
MARIRRNVWKLPSGDQTLVWYGRAIGEMQKRPITDPTSWRFQAAIHDYVRASDPLAKPGEKLPSLTIRRRFWSQCQHGSWFFLPWHRMYLHFFEEIVAAEVVKLGGPSDWALPYWNYSADLKSRLLPTAFRNPNLPNNTKNFLFVAQRDAAANAGQQFADAGDVNLQPSLTQANFSGPNPINFGGLATNFSHSGSGPGRLEIVPHGAMHVAVGGGQTGWMSSFNTAGLDPIFWLHHCNIDRLWEVWLNRDPGHKNPTSLQWLSGTPFSFHNAAKQKVTMRCLQVVDTNALGYTYDDISDPLAALPVPLPGPEAVMALGEPEMEVAMADSVPPELVGATETSIKVGNSPSRIRVATPAHAAARGRLAASFAAAAPADAAMEAATQQPRVLLQLENLTASGTANSYDVYVNIPEGQDPTQYQERHAGRIDLFGVAEASRASAQHPGSGLTYTLDISGIYQQLSTAPDWDPQNIDVSLVPVRKWEGATVTVGRVSVFFA